MTKAVVLGGTFNPLTYAHANAIDLAKRAVNADNEILVPASDKFMETWKNFSMDDILPLDIRLEILFAYAKESGAIVETCEVEGITYRTIETLSYLKDKYKYDEIYFLFGAEKVAELKTWYKAEELFSNYKFIIFNRNGIDAKKEIEKDSFTQKFIPNFVFVNEDNKYQSISSTKIRKALLEKDYKTIEKMTFPFVVDIMKKRKI